MVQDGDRGAHGLFFTAFVLILLAEFGAKTQIAVAGMGSNAVPAAVWAGATLALMVTSGIGVLAGRTILQRIPVSLLHRLSGGFFMLLGLVALAGAFR